MNLLEEMKMPQVKKNPHELAIHRDVRVDNYYWLNLCEGAGKELRSASQHPSHDLTNVIYQVVAGKEAGGISEGRSI